MKKLFKFFFFLFLIILLSGCSKILLMNPKGEIGLQQKFLILISLGLMLIIVIPVILITFFFVLKYNSLNIKSKYKPNWSYSNRLEILFWIIPIIIITILSFITLKSTYKLNPSNPISNNIKPIIIEVVSLDWKWLFIYPKENIATINEIMFPLNTPILFKITSNSVMNSFFIPQLGSQIYAMPGMKSELNLISNESGIYKGISSNFSGKGFSNMKFNVIVVKNKLDYETWINKIKKSKNSLISNNDIKNLLILGKDDNIKYFSNVKENLFNSIINKFINL